MKTIVEEVLQKFKNTPGALLPILHAIQGEIGYIPKEIIGEIAEGLNLSRAEVHGVVSFYHYFRREAPGKYVIQLCRAEACQAMGSRELEKHAMDYLSVNYHETTSDGVFSLESVYCLGNCACSPSLLINNDIYGRVSVAKFDEIISQLRDTDGYQG